MMKPLSHSISNKSAIASIEALPVESTQQSFSSWSEAVRENVKVTSSFCGKFAVTSSGICVLHFLKCTPCGVGCQGAKGCFFSVLAPFLSLVDGRRRSLCKHLWEVLS